MIPGSSRYRYKAWDGPRSLASIDPERLLDQVGERFLEEEAGQVLEDLLHRGLLTDDGLHLAGLDELRDALRQGLRDLADAGIDQLPEVGAAGLSGEAAGLLREMAANPLQAGRMLDGASPGVRDELTDARQAGGSLQANDQLAALHDLADLDRELRRIRSVDDVSDTPFEQIAAMLGDDKAAQFDALTRTLADFTELGDIDPSGVGLSTKALRVRSGS